MGRHSAPEDDVAESFDGAAVAVTAPTVSRGRHARSDEGEPGPIAFDDTARIARIDLVDLTAAEPAHPAPVDAAAVAQPRKRTHEHSTAADFALVREHGDVRARVIAAVLVPFVVYTGGMAAVSKLDRSYLLWIWIPLITAGALVGLFLDLAHHKYDR